MKTSMIKRFVTFLMAIMMVFACTAVFAEGDEYSVTDDRYPTKYWGFMTQEEIAHYEAIGWTRNTGVLWYDTEDNSFVDMFEVGDTQELINKGYVFHVIYTWICPGEKLGKYTEQSVSCGYWQLSAEQAALYHSTYEVPQLKVSESEKTGVLYESNWAVDGKYASEPDESMSEEELLKYSFVRVAYNEYFRGYGEDVVLLNGDVQVFSIEEALEIGGFDSEMPRGNYTTDKRLHEISCGLIFFASKMSKNVKN